MVHRLPKHQEVVGFDLGNLGANFDNSVKHCCCRCFHSMDIDFLWQYMKNVETSDTNINVYMCVCVCLPFMDSP